jgi:hypothetical protein
MNYTILEIDEKYIAVIPKEVLGKKEDHYLEPQDSIEATEKYVAMFFEELLNILGL